MSLLIGSANSKAKEHSFALRKQLLSIAAKHARDAFAKSHFTGFECFTDKGNTPIPVSVP